MAAKHPDRPSSRYQLLAAGSYSAGTTVELLATRTRTPKYELQPMPEFCRRTRKPGGGPKGKLKSGILTLKTQQVALQTCWPSNRVPLGT